MQTNYIRVVKLIVLLVDIVDVYALLVLRIEFIEFGFYYIKLVAYLIFWDFLRRRVIAFSFILQKVLFSEFDLKSEIFGVYRLVLCAHTFALLLLHHLLSSLLLETSQSASFGQQKNFFFDFSEILLLGSQLLFHFLFDIEVSFVLLFVHSLVKLELFFLVHYNFNRD